MPLSLKVMLAIQIAVTQVIVGAGMTNLIIPLRKAATRAASRTIRSCWASFRTSSDNQSAEQYAGRSRGLQCALGYLAPA